MRNDEWNKDFSKSTRAAENLRRNSVAKSKKDLRFGDIAPVQRKEPVNLQHVVEKSVEDMEREQRKEEDRNQVAPLFYGVCASLILYFLIVAFRGQQAYVDNTIEHSDEIISQYYASQKADKDESGVDILAWMKGMLNNFIGDEKNMGGK